MGRLPFKEMRENDNSTNSVCMRIWSYHSPASTSLFGCPQAYVLAPFCGVHSLPFPVSPWPVCPVLIPWLLCYHHTWASGQLQSPMASQQPPPTPAIHPYCIRRGSAMGRTELPLLCGLVFLEEAGDPTEFWCSGTSAKGL